MKTLWNKSYWIENYLFGKITKTNHSSLIKYVPRLSDEINWQKKVYYLLKIYHRKKEKERLKWISHQIFTDPIKSDFQTKIYRIFK